jgi:hypothetical protein
MRNFSANYREAVNSTSADELPVLLLEITHPDLPTPVRVVNDAQDLVSNGNTFTAVPFRAKFPEEPESGLPRAELAIDNIGKELVQWIDASGGGQNASCRMMQVLRSDPNTLEFDITLALTNLQVTATEVRGLLGFDDLLNRTAVTWTYKPELAPGLF